MSTTPLSLDFGGKQYGPAGYYFPIAGLYSGRPKIAQLASDGSFVCTLAAGSAVVGKLSIDQTTPGTTNGVQIVAALPAGTALLGKVGFDQTADGTTNRVFPIRRGTLVSKSSTCNGASQSVASANAARSYFSFQNPSGNSGTMWVDPLGGTAASGSPRIEVEPGKGFAWSGDAVPTNAITVIGTNGEKWTAYEY